MTAIAATTSPSIGAALAALISGGSNASDGGSSGSPSSVSSSGLTPQYGVRVATNVTLSDHAKSVLAQAKVDQVLAQQLSAQVAAGRSGGSGSQPVTLQSIEQIVASAQQVQAAQSGQTSSTTPDTTGQASPTSGIPSDGAAYLSAQQQAHINSDGSVTSWSQTFNDVLTVPTTPEEISNWYNTQGKQLVDANEQAATGSADLVQAIQSKSLKFYNANDISGLNFHNTFSYSGGFGGGGGGANFTYNSSASIFNDPNSNYLVTVDGTVISWAKPQAASSSS